MRHFVGNLYGIKNSSLAKPSFGSFSRLINSPSAGGILYSSLPAVHLPDRVRELKEALQTREVHPADITWRGRSGFAFLRFTNPAEDCARVLQALEGLTLQDQAVVVERAKDRGEEVVVLGEEEDLEGVDSGVEAVNGGGVA